MNRLLASLAAERYLAVSNRGEVLILTIHDGRNILKFSDGRYTVVSLPVRESGDKSPLCQYSAVYNMFNLHAADGLVQLGKYNEAEEMYKLLIHFDRCGNDLLKEAVSRRLSYLYKIKKGENMGVNKKELAKLGDRIEVQVDLSQLQRVTPTMVTNLLQVFDH